MSSSITATFVFTDRVDSTAVAARLGPEASEALRQTHLRLLRGAIASSGGSEVKDLGDGLMVVYSSPSRALAGAVGMQQAIERHNRTGGERLAVRIGVGAGEAVEDDGDYFGDPVVVAARLCAAAAGGQILAGDLVRSLVGRHATQSFAAVGSLELKGIPEPIEAVSVLWEPTDTEGAVPLPGRLVGAATNALFGFFGRAPEVAALDEARKRAHATRRCQVVFVAGEPGIGKTALLAQVARKAHAEGTTVLFGHADEDLGVGYQPWIEAVSGLVRADDGEVLDALPTAQRAALTRVIPSIATDAGGVANADTERLLLLEGTTELLATASRAAPVLVVFDDLHWVDAASLQLLRHVIASSTPMEVTIACTYRETDLGHGDPLTNLLADLHREANVTRIALAGLEDVDVVELMAAAAGHDLDDAGLGLAHALRRETDGNPFFTAEILRHLGETGRIVLGDDGRWTVAGELDELALPTSIRDVVGRRVARLGKEAMRVLRLAAVIGRDFDVRLLASIADVSEDQLLDLLDAAVIGAVLIESPDGNRYRFAHALFQHILYDALSATRRQRAHQRVAEVLERRGGDDAAAFAELARQWIAATRPSDLEKAFAYARRAGDAARDALAPDDAIRWYGQALELASRHTPPDEELRAELLIALGSAQRQAARAEHRVTLLEAVAIAERLESQDLLTNAALEFVSGLGTLVGDDDAKRVIRAALDTLSSHDTPTGALLLAALALTHDGATEWQARRELSLQALDAARRAGDDRTLIRVILQTMNTLATPDRIAECMADVERAVAVADRLGDPELRALSRRVLVDVRYHQADAVGIDAAIAEFTRLAEDLGLALERAMNAMLIAGHVVLAGRLDDAEIANNKALELGTAAGVPEASAMFGAIVYLIHRYRGELDEVADLLVDIVRDNPSIAVYRTTVINVLSEVGRLDEARERLAHEARHGFELPYDSTWLGSMANLADAAATLGDHTTSQILIDRLTPFAAQVVWLGFFHNGAIARPLARLATLLTNHDEAEKLFAIAHDVHERLRAPYWIARGQLDHADLCLVRRASGDVARVQQLARSAQATATEYGFASLEDRAAVLLETSALK
jgi:class 3 adenylate cyclase/tetratricopeptide (TPR) repeat protein